MSPTPHGFDPDLDDATLRARRSAKWAAADERTLPAWVAETDVATMAGIVAAVRTAVDHEAFGYPPLDDRPLRELTADFTTRRFGWAFDPDLVTVCGDVMSGVLLALTTLCEDAPVVVPTPAYPPFLDVVGLAGRELVSVPCPITDGRSALDLDGVAVALAAGARTVLIANPHNPIGRAYTRAELEDLRDVVDRYGARVVSDDIHAPLVLPGAVHVPYASLPGTEHAVTVLSASKAFNVPALKCAQLVVQTDADHAALGRLPPVANHGVSLLGVVANEVAYRDGGAWLDAFVAHLDVVRHRFAARLAHDLPAARALPLEATYLAWVDVTAYGHEHPAEVVRERGRLIVNDGATFGPGGAGHLRVNLGTSLDRVDGIVERLARALT
jgi:cystathionine beta-lyase